MQNEKANNVSPTAAELQAVEVLDGIQHTPPELVVLGVIGVLLDKGVLELTDLPGIEAHAGAVFSVLKQHAQQKVRQIIVPPVRPNIGDGK